MIVEQEGKKLLGNKQFFTDKITQSAEVTILKETLLKVRRDSDKNEQKL